MTPRISLEVNGTGRDPANPADDLLGTLKIFPPRTHSPDRKKSQVFAGAGIKPGNQQWLWSSLALAAVALYMLFASYKNLSLMNFYSNVQSELKQYFLNHFNVKC